MEREFFRERMFINCKLVVPYQATGGAGRYLGRDDCRFGRSLFVSLLKEDSCDLLCIQPQDEVSQEAYVNITDRTVESTNFDLDEEF